MIRLYLIALVSSFMTALAMTPVSIALARRYGAMDAPDPRKVHSAPRPRWGGIGIVAGLLVALLVVSTFIPEFGRLLKNNQSVYRGAKIIFTLNLGEQLAGILFGALLLFGVGLADDRKPMNPGMKFLLQIIAAYVAMTYGVRIYGISIPGFETFAHFPLWLMQLVTVLWIVGVTNAVNLIDGLDGLAGGVVAIVAGAFLAMTLVQVAPPSPHFHDQMRLAGVVAAALLGGVLGFLVYNFHPAHVFMGDSGSLTLGFLVACVAVIGAFKTTFLAILIVPFLLIMIPAADMAVAFVRRLLSKRSPFAADRGHFHHRLLDAGWSQREIVFGVYAVTLVLALISVTIAGAKRG